MPALQPNFEKVCCVREYTQLIEMIGHSLLVDREEFAGGYTQFAFDLSPDKECADHYSWIKTRSLRAEVYFAGALITTVNMVAYRVFDNMIEVNQWRHVLFDCMCGWTLNSFLGFFFSRPLRQRNISRCLPEQLAP